MTESLWGVAKLLAASSDLLGEHSQMVRETEDVLEDIDGSGQILFVVYSSTSHSLDEPERAHAESALVATDTIMGGRCVVSVHQPRACQAAFLWSKEDSIHGSEEARIVWRNKENKWCDQDR